MRESGAPGPGDVLAARRLRELEALYSVASTLHTSLDMDEVLHHALDTVRELFGFHCGVFRILDPPTGTLTLTVSSGLSAPLAEELEAVLRIGEGRGSLVSREHPLSVIPDLTSSAYADSAWARHGYRTLVTSTLQSQRMLLGSLTLASDKAAAFSASEGELLVALTNQIALAVANTELYAGAQHKIGQLSALHQCSRDMGPSLSLPDVLQLTAQRMAQLLRLERTAVLMHLPDSGELLGASTFGFPDGAADLLRAPLEELSAANSLMRNGQACLCEAPAEEGLLPAAFVQQVQVTATLGIPLLVEDRSFGLLIGDRGEQPLILSPDEMDLAMIFANQASVWIARARALSEATGAQAKFRDLLELAPDGILLVDREGKIGLVNGQAEAMFGYRREELLGEPVEKLIPERYQGRHHRHREGYLAEPRTRPMGSGLDLFACRKEGTEFPVEISLSPTSTDDAGFVITIIRDVTERKQAEQERAQLLASEQRKGEQLKLAVREAHHRIKNNLQAISDLLYLAMAAGGQASPEEILKESVERIQSIALVHDLLSQDEDVETVDMKVLSEQLVPMALRGGRPGQNPVDVQLQVPSLPLSSKKATTLALILNELVSNAVKHAFPTVEGGTLEVRLERGETGLTLTVRDNGPGLPPKFDLLKHSHVGLQVVRTLAERDLGGKFRLSRGPGLVVGVWFPE